MQRSVEREVDVVVAATAALSMGSGRSDGETGECNQESKDPNWLHGSQLPPGEFSDRICHANLEAASPVLLHNAGSYARTSHQELREIHLGIFRRYQEGRDPDSQEWTH